MKMFYILFCTLFIYSAVYAEINSDDYIIKITVDDGSIIELGVTDFQYEISNYANANGIPYEIMTKQALNNDIALWQFASQIIDLELLYLKAQQEGYAEKENVIEDVDTEIGRQISQAYASNVLDVSKLTVTDAEKRAYWNRISANVIAMYGSQATYARMEREIEASLIQEKMNAEYQSLIQKYRNDHGLKASMNQDPIISIGDYNVPKKDFDASFEQTLASAAGQIPLNNAEIVNQIKRNMFDTFVAQHIILYEAKQNGYENTEQGKIIDKFVRRSVITKKYIEDTIFEAILDSTDEEIEQAYNQFGQTYNIDSMSFEQAHKVLDSLVKQSKANQHQSMVSSELRYRYRIEKNLDLLKNVLSGTTEIETAQQSE